MHHSRAPQSPHHSASAPSKVKANSCFFMNKQTLRMRVMTMVLSVAQHSTHFALQRTTKLTKRFTLSLCPSLLLSLRLLLHSPRRATQWTGTIIGVNDFIAVRRLSHLRFVHSQAIGGHSLHTTSTPFYTQKSNTIEASNTRTTKQHTVAKSSGKSPDFPAGQNDCTVHTGRTVTVHAV